MAGGASKAIATRSGALASSGEIWRRKAAASRRRREIARPGGSVKSSCGENIIISGSHRHQWRGSGITASLIGVLASGTVAGASGGIAAWRQHRRLKAGAAFSRITSRGERHGIIKSALCSVIIETSWAHRGMRGGSGAWQTAWHAAARALAHQSARLARMHRLARHATSLQHLGGARASVPRRRRRKQRATAAARTAPVGIGSQGIARAHAAAHIAGSARQRCSNIVGADIVSMRYGSEVLAYQSARRKRNGGKRSKSAGRRKQLEPGAAAISAQSRSRMTAGAAGGGRQSNARKISMARRHQANVRQRNRAPLAQA